uniref:CASPASE_P20 domain-containing protein n=1 Tax=Angiostrongylus cantonensis TaxID=6313 RepID=A0A0K0CTF9_ANGCA
MEVAWITKKYGDDLHPRTLAPEPSPEDLLMQASRIRNDVIGLAETRRRHPFNAVYDTGKELLLEICDSRGVGGVGVLVNTNRQCMTYMSEEVGDFPSLLGNMSLDVEHDLRPFFEFSRQTTRGRCTPDGQVASYENLDNWKKAILHSKRYCHFSMHYMKTLTDDNSDYLTLLDKEMRNSLETLKANEVFENTVIALLSGTGNRRTVGDQLFAAQVEERSPLLSIKLPEKFRRKYHTQDMNIGINVNRLITTSDVGKTLMSIASVKALRNLTLESSAEAARSFSLLRYFHPDNRSCKDANIPAHLCLCMNGEIPKEYIKFVNYS